MTKIVRHDLGVEIINLSDDGDGEGVEFRVFGVGVRLPSAENTR